MEDPSTHIIEACVVLDFTQQLFIPFFNLLRCQRRADDLCFSVQRFKRKIIAPHFDRAPPEVAPSDH